MASTEYQYSIQDDFPNHKVAPDRLLFEIRNSAIVTAVDYINTSGDTCGVWFKDALSISDETVLNTIVAAHGGEPMPAEVQSVTLAGVPTDDDGKYQMIPNLLPSWTSLYFTGQGDSLVGGIGAGQAFTCSSDTSGNTEVEWIFTDQVHLVGGSVIFSGAEIGDKMDYTVSIPATATGTGSTNVSLVPYGDGNVIVPNPGGATTIDLEDVRLVPTIGTGYWDWDDPSQGFGTVTPNYNGTGNYSLLDYELFVGHPIVGLHVLGSGRLDFLMPNITPMKVLPRWKHKAIIYNSGHSGLKIAWMFVGGRGGAI